MKKTLVDHGGIIQWKFIISNDDELMQYAKHKSTEISVEFVDLITKKDKNKSDTNGQKVLKMVSKVHQVPIVTSCDVLLKNVILSMHKYLLKGETVVVNEAGGYCPWDDSRMSLAEETEENIAIANGDPLIIRNHIIADLENGPILVLENQAEIPERVEDYLFDTCGITRFSYIKNIQFEKDRLPEFIMQALAKQHHTFVTQTTLMDSSQVEMIASLM